MTNQPTKALLITGSDNPERDIQKVMYPGQPAHMRMYKAGYESFLNSLFILEDNDVLLREKMVANTKILETLGEQLADDEWLYESFPDATKFDRRILGIEQGGGSEIVVARWGKGHASPVHGHADGHLFEFVVKGKIKVNTYFITNHETRVVRVSRTDIHEKGTLISKYSKKRGGMRENVVHNFSAVEDVVSLHFLPEHTRDGRDNRFVVEYFDEAVGLTIHDVTRISGQEGMYSRVGDVILVRSENVPEYGDHYIVVLGHPVEKAHGMRPQDVAIDAPKNTLLDAFVPKNGLTLLKLNESSKKKFHAFHGIEVIGSKVLFNGETYA